MPLPEQVRTVVADYLAAMDGATPGLVQGLYLVDSVALNDFRPRTSDIDFVAVSKCPLDTAAVDVVRRVHRGVARRHRRARFNGPYVTWADQAGDPRDATPGTHVHGDGVVRADTRAERHPVTWHTLAQAGAVVRGPDPHAIDIWTDRAILTASIQQNLDGYWLVRHRRGSRLLSRPGLSTVIDWGPAWRVPGVSRLHHTLATGKITSKDGAGVYARETFPERWHKVIDECLRIRRQQPQRSCYRSIWTRRRDTLDFMDYAITDAHRIDNH